MFKLFEYKTTFKLVKSTMVTTNSNILFNFKTSKLSSYYISRNVITFNKLFMKINNFHIIFKKTVILNLPAVDVFYCKFV